MEYLCEQLFLLVTMSTDDITYNLYHPFA